MAGGKNFGRPSKGDRGVVYSRLASHRVSSVQKIAEERGMPVSDVMDALVAVGLAHLGEAALRPPREELPEGA